MTAPTPAPAVPGTKQSQPLHAQRAAWETARATAKRARDAYDTAVTATNRAARNLADAVLDATHWEDLRDLEAEYRAADALEVAAYQADSAAEREVWRTRVALDIAKQAQVTA